jgi:hypothetical protein
MKKALVSLLAVLMLATVFVAFEPTPTSAAAWSVTNVDGKEYPLGCSYGGQVVIVLQAVSWHNHYATLDWNKLQYKGNDGVIRSSTMQNDLTFANDAKWHWVRYWFTGKQDVDWINASADIDNLWEAHDSLIRVRWYCSY